MTTAKILVLKFYFTGENDIGYYGTLKEYKNKFEPRELSSYKIRGGLGADIGGDKWQKENDKRQRMKEFAKRVANNPDLM